VLTETCNKILYLVFASITDVQSVPVDSGLVKSDAYHPPPSIHVYLPYVSNALNCESTYRNITAGNYTLLYTILSTCDWSGVYKPTSVNVAVASLNPTVREAMEKTIPRRYIRKSKFPLCLYSAIRYYIMNKKLLSPSLQKETI
jgi:hypothetical protein